MANPVDMVVPGLYIGGQAGACNLQVLKQNGITHIVNSAAASCTDTFPHEFVYKSLPLIDTPSQNMLQHFGGMPALSPNSLTASHDCPHLCHTAMVSFPPEQDFILPWCRNVGLHCRVEGSRGPRACALHRGQEPLIHHHPRVPHGP
jgi:hypothetical protein